jgi:DNA-binding response OmpR family regulator
MARGLRLIRLSPEIYKLSNPAQISGIGRTMRETKKRVLVADDEEVIADTLAIILNQAGFEACAVYSGEEAVETARTFRPDMLISDVVMGGITGIEAALQVRAHLPSCKVLLFSGQAATVDLLGEARRQGHTFELLSKPVHPADLLARVRDTVCA